MRCYGLFLGDAALGLQIPSVVRQYSLTHFCQFPQTYFMNSSANSGMAGDHPINNSHSQDDDKLWTTEDLAEFLRVSVKTIFNLRKRGLPFLQVGGNVRFDRQEIKEYLAKNRRLASHRLRRIIRQGGQP